MIDDQSAFIDFFAILTDYVSLSEIVAYVKKHVFFKDMNSIAIAQFGQNKKDPTF